MCIGLMIKILKIYPVYSICKEMLDVLIHSIACLRGIQKGKEQVPFIFLIRTTAYFVLIIDIEQKKARQEDT